MIVRILLTVACLLFTVNNASAGIIGSFNLIALGDLSGASEVEGRVLVFGDIPVGAAIANAAFDGNALSNPVPAPLNQNDGLVVGGRIFSNVNVGTNSNVRIGGDVVSGVAINNASSVTYNDAEVPTIISNAISEIQTMEGFLSSLSVNSTVDASDRNQIKIDSSAVDDIAVFDIASDFFSSNGTIMDWTGDLNAELFVFRVAGSGSLTTANGFNVNSKQFNDDSFQERIIWDFSGYEGNLNFTNGLGGALFAPNANVDMGTPIEGLVIANDVNLGSEIHMPYLAYDFGGGSDDPGDDSGVVPEPGAFAVWSVLGLAACTRGRRRKRTA